MEMASLALRTAWSRPLIWEVILLEMARPAASSAAVLIRLPVDKRCIATPRSRALRSKAAWVISDLTLVLITLTVNSLFQAASSCR